MYRVINWFQLLAPKHTPSKQSMSGYFFVGSQPKSETKRQKRTGKKQKTCGDVLVRGSGGERETDDDDDRDLTLVWPWRAPRHSHLQAPPLFTQNQQSQLPSTLPSPTSPFFRVIPHSLHRARILKFVPGSSIFGLHECSFTDRAMATARLRLA